LLPAIHGRASFDFYDDSLTKAYGGWGAYDGTLTLANEFRPHAREQLRKAWAQGGRQSVGTDKFEVRALSPTLAMSSFAGKNEVTDASGKVTDSSLATMTAIWAKHKGQWYIIEQHQSFQPIPK
jgi:ketosteroid isomerase-like protein